MLRNLLCRFDSYEFIGQPCRLCPTSLRNLRKTSILRMINKLDSRYRRWLSPKLLVIAYRIASIVNCFAISINSRWTSRNGPFKAAVVECARMLNKCSKWLWLSLVNATKSSKKQEQSWIMRKATADTHWKWSEWVLCGLSNALHCLMCSSWVGEALSFDIQENWEFYKLCIYCTSYISSWSITAYKMIF